MLARPRDVVAARRTTLMPADREALSVWVRQVDKPPVAGNCRVARTLPLTDTVAERFVRVPLAYRMTSVRAPAAGALTANSMAAPTALALLTYPVPVKPGYSLSTTPLTIVACSASYRTSAAMAAW